MGRFLDDKIGLRDVIRKGICDQVWNAHLELGM